MNCRIVPTWLAIFVATGSAFVSPSPRRRAVVTTIMNAAASSSSSGIIDSKEERGRNIVIVGGGIQGVSVAYHLHESKSLPPGSTITILEAKHLASAASGKGGGFMARGWGDGTDTQALHEAGFDMYGAMCVELGVRSYRKLPVIGVSPGRDDDDGKRGRDESGKKEEQHPQHQQLANMIPNWLDGNVGRISPMGSGDDTAQVTPSEFVTKMMERIVNHHLPEGGDKSAPGGGVKLVIGTCVGVESTEDETTGVQVVTGVRYRRDEDGEEGRGGGRRRGGEGILLRADDVVVAAGPWACQAETWFGGDLRLPMEGVKSTSIVYRPPVDEDGKEMPDAVEATALFCGEDDRFGTHRELGSIFLSSVCSIYSRATPRPPLAIYTPRDIFPNLIFPSSSLRSTRSSSLPLPPPPTNKVEVYPRPDGTIYICGIGGSDYISTSELQASAYLDECLPKMDRVEAASSAFHMISNSYATKGELSHAQACKYFCYRCIVS